MANGLRINIVLNIIVPWQMVLELAYLGGVANGLEIGIVGHSWHVEWSWNWHSFE